MKGESKKGVRIQWNQRHHCILKYKTQDYVSTSSIKLEALRALFFLACRTASGLFFLFFSPTKNGTTSGAGCPGSGRSSSYITSYGKLSFLLLRTCSSSLTGSGASPPFNTPFSCGEINKENFDLIFQPEMPDCLHDRLGRCHFRPIATREHPGQRESSHITIPYKTYQNHYATSSTCSSTASPPSSCNCSTTSARSTRFARSSYPRSPRP